MADPREDVSALLGRSVAWLRRGYALRQEDVAEAAVASGLDWTQATVAGLETGRRRLSAVELLLLPHVVSLAAGDLVSLADMFAVAKGRVTLTPALRNIPAGEVLSFTDGSRAVGPVAGADPALLLASRASLALSVSVDEVQAAAARRWRGMTLDQVLEERVQAVVAQTEDTPRERLAVRLLLERPLFDELRMSMGDACDESA